MIRVLAMIAIAGFLLSVGSIAAAVAIAGPDALARGSWRFADGRDWSRHWGWDWRDDVERRDHTRWSGGDEGETTTRSLAWSGAERLDLEVAAEVRYIQTPGSPGTVEVTGPARAVSDLEITGDTIRYAHGRAHWRPELTIVVRAPNIAAFDVSGANRLEVESYRQPRLSLDVSGDADVTVVGETDDLNLNISGNGDADLGKLKTQRADVDAAGASDATIAPSDWARLDASGMADIRLLTRPRQLETDVSGAGRIHQDGGDSSPSPPSSNAPPAVAPKGAKT
ncbi:DUF2807 domain-containing protein [uncultured Phenylobacterium sp.]|uniref:GIN domain-containing protein n=1 Tax=uncultured Phenylobacterium sp. TaxID=349273 RepID=UPI0025E17CF1|nr:DUF2807 domain-containing protein [uncultured Phenylobacterium sp.]